MKDKQKPSAVAPDNKRVYAINSDGQASPSRAGRQQSAQDEGRQHRQLGESETPDRQVGEHDARRESRQQAGQDHDREGSTADGRSGAGTDRQQR
ncbi:MAG: hypothetical protein E6Q40_14360 [Cupriavidus sp.]|nr:MAG: hypothetical protein E6Q40_14360 [Cupriavidus sp.]